MARRIRWQIVIAVISSLLITGLLGRLALLNSSVASPLVGGAYVESVIGAPVEINPLLNDPLADPAGRSVAALLFDGLVTIGADGLPEPALATSWTVDPDGEVYTFVLRRNVLWHDGQPFTADDVLFTLRAIQSPDFTGDPLLAQLWRNVQVDRLDAATLRIRLDAPYAPFLALARVPILPAHSLAGFPIATWPTLAFARQPIGTGPFQLTELNNAHALLQANSTYYRGRPFIDSVELRFIDTAQAAIAALMRGETLALGTAGVGDLRQVTLPTNVDRVRVPLDEYAVLTFNLRRAPLDRQPLRLALAQGLDKDLLVSDAVGVEGQRLDTPILPGWWAYDPAATWYAYDTAEATKLLGELGYTLGADGMLTRDGQPLVLPLITDNEAGRLAAARSLARQWGAIGVKVEIEQLDRDELLRRLRSHDFTLALHAWARLGPDPDVYDLWHSDRAESGLNYAGLRDATIDDVLAAARTESELATRSDDYAVFQKRWIELVPSITLYQPRYSFVADRRLGGLGFGGDMEGSQQLLVGREDRYRNVVRWFLNSSREIRGDLR